MTKTRLKLFKRSNLMQRRIDMQDLAYFAIAAITFLFTIVLCDLLFALT